MARATHHISLNSHCDFVYTISCSSCILRDRLRTQNTTIYYGKYNYSYKVLTNILGTTDAAANV